MGGAWNTFSGATQKLNTNAGKTLGLYGGGGLLGKGQSQEEKDQLLNLINDDTGMPTYEGYTSLVDPSTGLLPEQYQLKSALSKDVLDKLQSEGLAEGPSTWAQLQLDMQAADQAKTLQDLAASSQGQASNAASNLAMRGGVSSGAQERIQSGALKNLLAQEQEAKQAGAQQKLGILSQDEQTKLGILQNLPNVANYYTGVDQYNIGNLLNDYGQKEASKLAQYQEQMKAYAAKKAGLATLYGGGGGKKG